MAPVYANETTTTGTSTSTACSKPTGTVAGDLLIAAVNTGSGGTSFTAPSGWAAIIAPWSDSNDTAGAVWYKVAGGSEPSSYTFTWSPSYDFCCSIKRVTGASTTTPIRAGARHDQASSTGASFTSTALSGTQATDLTMVVAQMGDNDGVTSYTVTSPGSPWTTIDNFMPSGSPKFQGASWAGGSQAGVTFMSTSGAAFWNITSFAVVAAGVTVAGAASLTGAGAVAAAGGTGAKAALAAAAGAITVAVTVGGHAAFAAVTGLPAPHGVVAGTVTLTGAGGAGGVCVVAGHVTLPGVGGVTAAGVHAGHATLPATGTVTGVGRVAGVAELDGAGTAAGYANSQSAEMDATTTLDAVAAGPGGAEMDAVAFLTATGVIPGITELDGQGGLGAEPLVQYAAELDGAATIAAIVELDVTAELDGSADLTAYVPSGGTAEADGAGVLTAAASVAGVAELDGAGALTADPVMTATAELDAAGTVAAIVEFDVTAELDGLGGMFAAQGTNGIALLAAESELDPAATAGAPAGLVAAGTVTAVATNRVIYDMSFM